MESMRLTCEKNVEHVDAARSVEGMAL